MTSTEGREGYFKRCYFLTTCKERTNIGQTQTEGEWQKDRGGGKTNEQTWTKKKTREERKKQKK